MKKFLSLLLVMILCLSLAACGDTADGDKPQKPAGDTPAIEPAEKEELVPVDILTKVWDSYAEDDKFAAAGGENMGGPGVLTGDMATPESLDYFVALPTSQYEYVKDPAQLTHMMNANTFTCGVYSVVSPADPGSVAAAIKDNIMAREWMCGFPDKLIVVSVGNCILDAFGNAEIMDTFKGYLTAAYPEAVILYEENIF